MMLNGHVNSGLTQTEWRLRYIERLIDEGQQRITPIMCMQFCNHVQSFFASALELRDMPVGN